jgi:hypothetical protein
MQGGTANMSGRNEGKGGDVILAAFGSFFALSVLAAFSPMAATISGLVVLAILIAKFVALVLKELKH